MRVCVSRETLHKVDAKTGPVMRDKVEMLCSGEIGA